MISQLKAHLEQSGDNTKQVLHFWEGEVKPYTLGESSAQLASKLEQLQKYQTQILNSLQKHLEVFWGKDKVLQALPSQALSLKNFLAEQKKEDLLLVSFAMGASLPQGYLVVEKNFFYFLYSFIFGGNHFVEKITPLSKMEKNYFEQFVQDFFSITTKAWKPLGLYHFKAENYYLDEDAISKLICLGDFAASRIEVVSGEAKYGFSILYPKELLGIFEEARTGQLGAQVQRDEIWEDSVLKAISTTTSVKVEAELGTLSMLLKDALELQVGQVFALNLNESGHAVFVDGKKACVGKMGSVGEWRAVQILEGN